MYSTYCSVASTESIHVPPSTVLTVEWHGRRPMEPTQFICSLRRRCVMEFFLPHKSLETNGHVLVSSLYRHDKLWFHWVSSVPHSVVRVCVCVCAWCLLRMKTNCFHKVKFTHELGFLSDRNCFFVLKICASLAELCISKKHTSSFAQQIIVFLSIQKLG